MRGPRKRSIASTSYVWAWMVAAALLPPIGAAAQTWPGIWNGPDGRGIYGQGSNAAPQAISDLSGGAYVMWSAEPSERLFLVRVNANGDPPSCRQQTCPPTWWTTTPRAVSSYTGSKEQNPAAVTEFCGGLYVVWEDNRDPSGSFDLYAQHVNPDGTLSGSDVAVAGMLAGSYYPAIATSINGLAPYGQDGAIIAWESPDTRQAGRRKIYAQKASGSTGACGPGVTMKWAPDSGVAVTPVGCAAATEQDPAIVSDGSGGAIIAFVSTRDGSQQIYTQHVLNGGTLDAQWGGSPGGCGARIAPTAYSQTDPRLVRETTAPYGALVVWVDDRPNAAGIRYKQLYACRLKQDGTVLNGVFQVCSLPGDASNLVMTPDYAGGAIIAFDHFNPDDPNPAAGFNLYAQKIASDGHVVWPGGAAQPVAVCVADNAQHLPSIDTDGQHGAIISWQDFRESQSTPHVYLHCVLSGGNLAPRWGVAGERLSTNSMAQRAPAVLLTAYAGAVAVWEDDASGSTGVPGISAEQSQACCLTGVDDATSRTIEVSPAGPNPFRQAVRLTAALAARSSLTLEVFDVQGRRLRTLARGSFGPGMHAFEWDGTQESGARVAPGLYLLRTRIGASTWQQKIVRLP